MLALSKATHTLDVPRGTELSQKTLRGTLWEINGLAKSACYYSRLNPSYGAGSGFQALTPQGLI